MNFLPDQNWDVIVIGTGIGGGTVGRALAEAGKKVLFVEKGPRGHRRERTPLSHDIFVPEARLARGLWPARMRGIVNGKESLFFGPLGSGLGGSSTFYAATLERPAPHDLDDSAACPHPGGAWPVSYAEFEPYLSRAEALFHVSGTPDPLSPPPSRELSAPHGMNDVDKLISRRLQKAGMTPYHLHSAIRRLEDCEECLGIKCPRACKMDGRSAGVEPALATGNAELLDCTEITRLESEAGKITGLVARRAGEILTLSAPVVVLAGGAFGTPRLCLASTSEAHPNGIANASGLVGRGLMFHLNEMLAVWPGLRGDAPSKSVGLRDFLCKDGMRLGMVQSMGINASYGEILHYLRQRLGRSRLGGSRLLQEAARLPASLAAILLGEAKIFVGLMEDFPYDENRVLPTDTDEIVFEYRTSTELHKRRKVFRKALRTAFRGQRHLLLSGAPELNYGHPSGTMRFGDDPASSVLRADGRTHDLSNLYVADASFMPSSMGVNPSLTIAAQALRVSEAILQRGSDG